MCSWSDSGVPKDLLAERAVFVVSPSALVFESGNRALQSVDLMDGLLSERAIRHAVDERLDKLIDLIARLTWDRR
jgi:hypothetical protein